MIGECQFMMIKNDKIRALYSNDLIQFLTKVGKYDAFLNETLKCRYCKDTIKENNLYAFIPLSDDIDFCCSNPACISKLSKEALK